MFKPFAVAIVFSASLVAADQVGVPPHSSDCATQDKDAYGNETKLPWGLDKDYDMGGCKCADDTMEWMPNAPLSDQIDEQWACYCQVPNTYESWPVHDRSVKPNDKNRRECGVIIECQNTAVLQQKATWNSKQTFLKKQFEQQKLLSQKQLVQEDEVNKMHHIRLERTKHNRLRAKVALSAVASKYQKIKMEFVNGAISKQAMQRGHAIASQQVASIKNQFQIRQEQIDEALKLILERQRTMETFVTSDLHRIEDLYKQKSADLKQIYGSRIDYYMQIPIIENVQKKWNKLPSGSTWSEWIKDDKNLRAQEKQSVCPLFDQA